MKVLKNRKFIILISSLIAIILVAYLSYGTVASWLTKETLQSSVEISLLLQGDEADIYESPVTLTSKGTYELAKIGTKDKDGNYVGNDVGVGELPEQSRKNYYDYVMPGVNIPKDPKIFVTKKSGALAYLYLEVLEENFPKNFTDDGFNSINVNSDANTTKTSPIYYELEDHWTPVVNAVGEHQNGKNGGKLYVYYVKNDDYFDKYNQVFYKDTAGEQHVTYLSSYIMKTESDTHIKKDTYFGINEVKKDADGKDKACPYFNILKKDTIYVSEKYIHPEYYSSLFSTVGNSSGIKSEGSDYDFGLYFYSYMASAKVGGTFIDPYNAYFEPADKFKSEKDYLEYLYALTDEHNGELPIYYVWNRDELQDAANDYLNYMDSHGKYNIVVMDSFDIEPASNVGQGVMTKSGVNFILDMNGKTLSATVHYSENISGTYHLLAIGQNSTVEITGNGNFYLGNDALYRRCISVGNYAKLIVKNGSFVRAYDSARTYDEMFNSPLINIAQYGSATIYDGYFDNGYWNITHELEHTTYLKNAEMRLPVYDTKNGTGWLKNEDGSFVTALPGDDNYGPYPRGIATALAAGGGNNNIRKVYVLGGTFVVQNPAWGDELACHDSKSTPVTQEDINPWFHYYSAGTQAVFLYGQELYYHEGIPDGYKIIETNTTYSYVDENGETQTFYVPVYTVNYTGEIPD